MTFTKSKELDDNNLNKNDRKDPKTIAALVNEGRFSYPYIPTGIYAEIRNLSNLRFQTQEELTRIKNRRGRAQRTCLLWDVGNGSDSGTDYGRDNVGDVLFCGIGE